MTALLKTVLLLSATLLLTSVLLRYWLKDSSRLGKILAVAAAVVLMAASVLDLYFTLQRVIGFVDSSIFWQYVQSTRHGQAVTWRIAITVLLLIFSLQRVRNWQLLLLIPGWLAALATFSYTSHAAAMGGTAALVIDWLHFLAAGVWTSVILAVSLSAQLWRTRQHLQLLQKMRTVSAVGLISVLVVALSGVMSSLFHVGEPERFVTSPYGLALAIKIVLVLLTIAIAAINRFRFLPQLERQSLSFGLRRALLAESVMLLAIFAATGLLTTSALPHGQEVTGPFENLIKFWNYLWR